MNYKIISFLLISSFVSVQGQSKDIADSLAQPVGICQEVGLNLTGKSTQRASCLVLIAALSIFKKIISEERARQS
jgi:hypothetical protein